MGRGLFLRLKVIAGKEATDRGAYRLPLSVRRWERCRVTFPVHTTQNLMGCFPVRPIPASVNHFYSQSVFVSADSTVSLTAFSGDNPLHLAKAGLPSNVSHYTESGEKVKDFLILDECIKLVAVSD